MLDEAYVKRIAEEAADRAAHRAVRETLVALGVDPDRPLDFQERMQFLKTLQTMVKTAVSQSITAFVGILIGGIIWAVWVQTGVAR